MKRIIKYQIVDHGVEHEQYFRGCGVAYTEYDECYTGIGNSLREALEDAAEQIAIGIPEALNVEIDQADATDYSDHQPDETRHVDCGDTGCFAESNHYYASIWVKYE